MDEECNCQAITYERKQCQRIATMRTDKLCLTHYLKYMVGNMYKKDGFYYHREIKASEVINVKTR